VGKWTEQYSKRGSQERTAKTAEKAEPANFGSFGSDSLRPRLGACHRCGQASRSPASYLCTACADAIFEAANPEQAAAYRRHRLTRAALADRRNRLDQHVRELDTASAQDGVPDPRWPDGEPGRRARLVEYELLCRIVPACPPPGLLPLELDARIAAVAAAYERVNAAIDGLLDGARGAVSCGNGDQAACFLRAATGLAESDLQVARCQLHCLYAPPLSGRDGTTGSVPS
jgi:hypothetical protein